MWIYLNTAMERGLIYKMLILNGLTKRFDGVHAVKNISFKARYGQKIIPYTDIRVVMR